MKTTTAPSPSGHAEAAHPPNCARLVPNGQSFQKKPLRVRTVTSSHFPIIKSGAGLPHLGAFAAGSSQHSRWTAGIQIQATTEPRTESRQS